MSSAFRRRQVPSRASSDEQVQQHERRPGHRREDQEPVGGAGVDHHHLVERPCQRQDLHQRPVPLRCEQVLAVHEWIGIAVVVGANILAVRHNAGRG